MTSRWMDQFKQHPFQPVWSAFKLSLENVDVDDQTIPTSVAELARLKRVVWYLDAIIETVDPDLTPRSVWDNFHSQLNQCVAQVNSYISNKNIGHIVQANEHADNLLTYVRPYLVLPQDALGALRNSTSVYVEQLERYVKVFQEKVTVVVDQVVKDRDDSAANLAAAKKNKTKVDLYVRDLFEGSEEAPAVKNSIDELVKKTTESGAQVIELHDSLLVGTPQALSLQAKIQLAATKIGDAEESVDHSVDAVEGNLRDLQKFYDKIFGEENQAAGKRVGGLESELGVRMKELENLEGAQKVKHAALFAQIETLLPGATSAGLATAYRSLKSSFDSPLRLYTRMFYGSLGVLVLASIIMSIQKFSIYPEVSLAFVSIPEWDAIVKALLFKVPFVAPVVWLALFSAKRRSQYERLQQEYAHKEAFASSYESYKKQMQELKDDSELLQKELMAKAVEAISYNASSTLDGKHDEKLPIHQFLEKLSSDDLKKAVEFFKGLKPA